MEHIQPHMSLGPADWFTGDVFPTIVLTGTDPSRVRMASVHFSPCARTAWHSHALGQYLHIVEGTALVQERGEPVVARRHASRARKHRRRQPFVWRRPASLSSRESEWPGFSIKPGRFGSDIAGPQTVVFDPSLPGPSMSGVPAVHQGGETSGPWSQA